MSANGLEAGFPGDGRTLRTSWGARPAPDLTSIIAHLAFITCLCLQRFGIPVGGELPTSISLPVFWFLTLWMLVSGRGRISASMAWVLLLFVLWTLMSTITAVLAPDVRVGFSLNSLLEVLALNMMLIVRPAGDFDSRKVLRIFLFYARLCAVCGIIQFVLQFVGLRLFSFGAAFPFLKPVLLESGFAWNPLLSYGSTTLRSNGFFLLEPSMFSQVLALAVLVDFFILGRWKFLPLYTIAYMASYSGTGLLSLSITLALVGLTSLRSSSRLMVMGVVALATAALFAVLVPDQFAVFVGRFGELTGAPGSSGHARYVAQLQEFEAFGRETRSLIGYGPGATLRSIYYVPGSGNPVLQLFVDYGTIGALLFYIYLCMAVFRVRFAALSIMLILNFQLGGGYLLFAPNTLLLAALGIWGTEGPNISPVMSALSRRWSRLPLGFGRRAIEAD